MRNAFDEDENALKLDQFNEKAAKRTYQQCCEHRAAEYLAMLPEYNPSKDEKVTQAKESNAGLSLSEVLL